MVVKERTILPSAIGLSTIIPLIFLFAVLLGTGGLYLYKASLIKNISTLGGNLKLASDRFEPSKISELQTLDKRLRASNQVLSHHVAVSPIFQVLQELTMKTVRYTSFNYTMPNDATGVVSVRMSGLAIGYRSVALQADLFTKNKNLIDPVFSNLQLDDRGNVIFDLTFSVDANFVNYKQKVLTAGNN